MDSQTINFITWNVNGLKQNRDQKFRKIQNADVVFLQETHIGEDEEDIIQDLKKKFYVFYTKYTCSSKGTAILVRKRQGLGFTKISDEKDHCGTYVVLKCNLNDQPYTLVSVYNHQKDAETLDKLSRYLQLMTTGLLVIGGDFNTVLNPFIDKVNSNGFKDSTIHKKLRSCAEMFMKSLQLVDVWRRKNPVNQNYTFCRNGSESRLDYFFVPDECVWRVKSCEIRDSASMRDHFPVYLEINSAPTMLTPTDTQSDKQRLNAKIAALREEMGSSLDEESPHAVNEADIVSAIQCLQVSDTQRPDSIPVSVYKDNIQEVIPYIKMLCKIIHRNAFNCSEKHFNETVKSPHDDSQHFFNVDYLIIATILAKRLDDFLSQPEGSVPKDSATVVMITPKTVCTKMKLSSITDETQKQKQSNPHLHQDFLIVKNLLRDAPDVNFSLERDKLLDQGCPLTPVLKTLALKCFASTLHCNAILVFKESMILSVQLDAAVNNKFKEECEYKELPSGIVNEAGNEEEQSEAENSVEGNGGEQGQLRNWIPLKKSNDVKRFNNILVEERWSKELVEYLSQPVNPDLHYIVTEVMNRLFAKHSLSDFTWERRQGQKETFSKLKILGKIIDAVNIIIPGLRSDKIEKEIKDQFQNYTTKQVLLAADCSAVTSGIYDRCRELECIFCTIQTRVPGAVFTDPVPTVQ